MGGGALARAAFLFAHGFECAKVKALSSYKQAKSSGYKL